MRESRKLLIAEKDGKFWIERIHDKTRYPLDIEKDRQEWKKKGIIMHYFDDAEYCEDEP